MKRFISVLLSGVLFVTAAACTQDTTDGSSSTTTTTTTTSVTTTEATEATSEVTTSEATVTTVSETPMSTEAAPDITESQGSDLSEPSEETPVSTEPADTDGSTPGVTEPVPGTDGTDGSDGVAAPAPPSMEALNDVRVEKGADEVSIHLPAEIVGDVTAEEVENDPSVNLVSVTKHDDGSMTYVMTAEEHQEMIDSYATDLRDMIDEFILTENYAVTKVDMDDALTTFDVYLETEEIGMAESMIAPTFIAVARVRGAFSGETVGEITVNYYGPDGTLIDSLGGSELPNG